MHISLAAEHVFTLFGFPITNTLLMSWIAIAILIIISIIATRKLQLIPSPLQNVVESIVETMLNFIEKVVGEKKQAEQFFPLIATIFIFILLSNWLGLVPGIGTIGFFEIDKAQNGHEMFIPFFRSTNSDINMTLALAIVAVIATQIFGITAIGTFKYISRYINFKNPILTFTGILELIAEIAKLISFSFRLFGNIFAGEVLLVVIAFLIPFIAPLPFMVLELFVGFVQALIFAMLTLVFLKIATSETH
ncbi:F0F1 ATP synthase subunit A [Patescibacteria group bacterium AH-259-L05]|nr:F0F1 ATP synthase subunit A [Patescibacteria group bacterium AH-259-L05]